MLKIKQPEQDAAEAVLGSAGPADYQSPEVWEKVTGRAVYGCDLSFPGMLVGKILRSPHPHARIKRIDAAAARALPGVKAVLTAAEINNRAYGIVINDELPLAAEKVRYIGDEVAAVAAVDEAAALRALQAIAVDYELLPAVFTPEEALGAGAPRLHEDFPGNIAWERMVERGEVERAFREADLVVEDTFSTQTVNQLYLEPISCVAVYDRYRGLTLHTALQSPHLVRDLVAAVLELPPSRVRIVGPCMGGGFGARVYGNLKVYILSAMLAMAAARPVKIQLTREEEFIAGRPMVPAAFKIRLALRRDGTILAREIDLTTDNGAYSAQAPFVTKTISERNDSLYRIPNIRLRARLVYTNKVPTGQYRAYGNQTANFACESILDMAAKKLGLDPLEIRLKNCVREGDISAHGLKIKSCALDRCFAEAAAAVGWHERKPGRGYGISGAVHANGSIVAHDHFVGASAAARLERDGRITVFTGEQDYGQGTHAAFSRIAARVLALPPQAVTVQSRDTLFTPYSQGAFAMRQTTIGGHAVRLAAEKLKEMILEEAAAKLSGELHLEDGAVCSSAGDRLTLAEIGYDWFCRHHGFPMEAPGIYDPGRGDYDETGYGDIAVTYSFAAHAAEVELDRSTGALVIHRLVAVHDSGKVLNLAASRGQVYGGVAQGIGYGCLEGYIFRDGRVLNPNMANYHIPTSLDLPPIEARFVDKEDPAGPFGAKGLGEIVMVPVLGAVANAVADAAGGWIRELPITPEKIHRVLCGRECCS